MKKITAISVVSLLLLASCGGKGKDAASMDYGLEEANEVISYYNTSIDITKKMVDMGEISKIIDYMQKNGKTLVDLSHVHHFLGDVDACVVIGYYLVCFFQSIIHGSGILSLAAAGSE
jgi:hypothetical protein